MGRKKKNKFCQWVTYIRTCCPNKPIKNSLYCKYHHQIYQELVKEYQNGEFDVNSKAQT